MITTLVAAAMLTLAPMAHTSDVPQSPATQITEDDPGWSCVADGNRICGPNNSEGKTPACYNDVGAIVAAWPCHIKVNADGSADVYEGVVDVNGQPVECRDICLGA